MSMHLKRIMSDEIAEKPEADNAAITRRLFLLLILFGA